MSVRGGPRQIWSVSQILFPLVSITETNFLPLAFQESAIQGEMQKMQEDHEGQGQTKGDLNRFPLNFMVDSQAKIFMSTSVRAFERASGAGPARRIHSSDPVAVRGVRRGPCHMPREQATTGTQNWAQLLDEQSSSTSLHYSCQTLT